ncbi:MAG: 2-hydroxyacid dehydrogenase [Gemmatimonadales bacterium]
MKVALLGSLATAQRERLEGLVTTPIEFVPLVDETPFDAVRAGLSHARAAITMRYDRSMPEAPGLELLQVGGAGYDAVDLTHLPPGCQVCNAFGHEVPIAEYVVLAMLQWCSRFMEAERSFRIDGSWRLGGRTAGPYQDELAGKTVGILGYGHIGEALAPRAKAMDTTVMVCSRTERPLPLGVDWFGGVGQLDDFLTRIDFLIVTAALTPETTGMIGARELGLLRSTAVVINVARGQIIDEDALYASLATGQIGGAVLDAWYRYPTPDAMDVRPSRHPFHELPNVYMTPHSSAWTTGMVNRRWATIAANLDRLARGEPLLNVVHRA